MKTNKLEKDILRWEYDNETKTMYDPPLFLEWLKDKLIESRKQAVIGSKSKMNTLVISHSGLSAEEILKIANLCDIKDISVKLCTDKITPKEWLEITIQCEEDDPAFLIDLYFFGYKIGIEYNKLITK
jgi:hypothetical protein